MENEINKSLSISEIVGILRRRGWLLLVCLVVILVPILIYNYSTVPVYRGSTKVIFEDSEKVMGQTLLGGFDKANFIANQIEEMKTKTFAEEVYAKLPETAKEQFETLSYYSTEFDKRSFTVNDIKKNLSFTPIRGTEIITISFDSEAPELAKTVANTTAEVLIQRNLSVRRKQYSNVKKFIEKQFEIVKNRLQEAETALKEFKEEENVTSLADESREILQRTTQAEIVYNEVRSNKKELQERLSAIRKNLQAEKSELPANIVKTTSPLSVKLKERLVELEVMYSNLQVQGFPENNPKMLDLKKEIEHVKQNLVQESLKINNEENLESLMDPFSQIRKYLEETVSLEVELQALQAKERNLRNLLKNYSNTLKSLPAKELTLVRLMRDKEVNNKLYMTLLEEREKARIKEASEIANIRILEPARQPGSAIRPRKALNLTIGVFSGIFLGIFLAFVLEYFNERIRTQDDIEKDLGLPVIAVIPKEKKGLEGLFKARNGKLIANHSYHNSMLFDAYNLLSFALDKNQNKSSTVMITSSIPNEGKSTIASLLAVTSAQRGKKTLLVDGDLRRPTLHTIFDMPREPGLTNLIVDFRQRFYRTQRNTNHSNDDQTRNFLTAGLIQTQEKDLLFLPSGFVPQNPVRIWSTEIWEDLLHHLHSIVDLVIFDAPPILGVAETTMMATYMEHILLCVEADCVDRKTLRRSFKMFKEAVPESDEKVVGAVLNKADLINLYGGYKYYRYYSNYKSQKSPELPSHDFTNANQAHF